MQRLTSHHHILIFYASKDTIKKVRADKVAQVVEHLPSKQSSNPVLPKISEKKMQNGTCKFYV
jgi:hypothetical protein